VYFHGHLYFSEKKKDFSFIFHHTSKLPKQTTTQHTNTYVEIKKIDNVSVEIDLSIVFRIMGDEDEAEDPELVKKFVYEVFELRNEKIDHF